MPYFLHHYFDPDFDHRHLRPKEMPDGSVDHYNLGYVQNVIQDQVLAEFKEVSEEAARDLDQRFVHKTPELPVGRNCRINPANPLQLMAEANGFALYEDDVISVRRTLNVRRDVDFHTGNILFVGDLVVHGNVRAGFALKARNILVKGTIGPAELFAQDNVIAEAGIKGGGKALIEAGNSIRAPFCENSVLKAGNDIYIDGGCLNSDLYVHGRLAIKGRFLGGVIHATSGVLVSEQLGGGAMGMVTEIHLGRDPFEVYKLESIDEALEDLQDLMGHYRTQMDMGEAHAAEFGPKLEKARAREERLQIRKAALMERMHDPEAEMKSVLMVPGQVRPGVLVSIGGVDFKVNDYYSDVRFTLKDGEIIVTSPAMRHD